MHPRLLSFFLLLAFVLPTACGSAPDTAGQPGDLLLHDLAVLNPMLGVWKLDVPEAQQGDATLPESGSLRMFPTLKGSVVEGYGVFRYADGTLRVSRQMWSRAPGEERLLLSSWSDTGAQFSGSFQSVAPGQLQGEVQGRDESGGAASLDLSFTAKEKELLLEYRSTAGQERSAKIRFVRD